MDPYLEGYLWPDVHQRLATEISRRLAPRLKPRYVARLAVTMVEDIAPAAEIGIMYPDVEVVRARRSVPLHEAQPKVTNTWKETHSSELPPITPAPLSVPYVGPIEIRLVSVEVRDTAQNELVTAIEIISPVNKREPGLSGYRRKRQRLHDANVHLLELDLIRRGTRPAWHPHIPATPYLMTLTRAGSSTVEVWPLRLQDPLPVLPVPLRDPDPDVPLELSATLTTIYDEAAYELSIDYTQPPPPPPLSEEDAAWVRSLFSDRSTRS